MDYNVKDNTSYTSPEKDKADKNYKPEKVKDGEEFDVIIIGGGSAGYPAAVYSGRFNLKTLVIAGDRGGLLKTTHVVENYPGFVRLSGPEIMSHMESHVKDYQVPILDDFVKEIKRDGKDFIVKTDEKTLKSKTVILATGTEHKKLGVPGEKEFYGRGVSYCATCLPPNESIILNSSIQEIGKVTPMNRVLTVDGTYQEIGGFTKTDFDGELMSIRPRFFNEPTLLTPNHPILATNVIREDGNKWLANPRFLKPEWIDAGNLTEDNCILYPIISENEDKKFIRFSDFLKLGKKGSNVVSLRPTHTSVPIKDRFPVNEDFMRLAGYYIAEGTSHKHQLMFFFKHDEKEYIEDVARILKNLFGLKANIKRENNVRRIVVYSRILSDFFGEQFGKGAPNKKLPHWSMLLPKKKQAELIKGLWRGDGCIRDKDFCLATSSRNLAYQTRDVLLRLGMIPSIQIRKLADINKKPSIINGRRILFNQDKYHITVGGPFLEKMCKILEYHHPKLDSRKWTAYHAWIRDGFAILPIREIKRVKYKGPVLNIAVNGNNTYVAKNFIVHNCDGPLFKGKIIGVVGGSDSAAKEALLLSEYGSKVYIIYRREKIRPEPINMERVEKKIKEGKIEIISNTNVTEIKGEKGITHVILDKPYRGSKEFKLGGLFIAIGQLPQSHLGKHIGVEVNEKDEVVINKLSETNIPGFFAAGDVVNTPWKQAIIGAAEGCMAAYSAYEYINGGSSNGTKKK